MKNVLKVSHADRTIVMDRTFAKFATNTASEEYVHLQQVRRDYPTYTVVQRQIKKNTAKECYRGLTYTYMDAYIKSHGSADDLHTYNEMMLISKCHSTAFRYPTIKKWFLDKFPEVKAFGIQKEDPVEAANITTLKKTA